MKLLVSVQSLEEAKIAVNSGCDILDIKNPAEGSLGANFPWVLKDIINSFPNIRCETSATIGDLYHKPGTASLAGYAVASLGIKYVKAGLYDSKTYEQAVEMISTVKRAVKMANKKSCFVAAGFADWRKINGLNSQDLVRATIQAKGDVVLLDTFIKDGSNLFDNIDVDELCQLVDACHKSGIKCALAGSIKLNDLDKLAKISPDFIGVRGALCSDQKNRKSSIDADRTREFVQSVKKITTKVR
jgi:hypothetical protein